MGYIKSRFNETIRYDSVGNYTFFSTLRKMHPLPSAYSEVKYLSCYKNDCIVINDVNTGLSEDIGVTFKFQTKNTNMTILCGGGVWNKTDSPAAGGHNYVFCFWQYSDDNGNRYIFWSPSGQNINNKDGTLFTIDNTKPIWVNMYHKANDYAHCEVREEIPDFIRSLKQPRVQTSKAPNVTCGPLGFFNAPFWCVYYNNSYGFPYNNISGDGTNNYTMGYHSVGRRIFSDIIIYNPSTMAVRKYLYTCYKKSTHQYGLYDSISGTFYGAVREMYVSNYWNDDNYYWDRIDAAAGDTLYAKECTLLNICGPEDQ